MKLVTYMYKKFAGIFLGSMVFFVLILCLTDLFVNLWNYISKNVGAPVIGTILLYYVPKAAWYSVPIAMLFATAYMLSDLYAKNELLAVFASGVSLFRFTAPLLLVGIAMSFGLFFFEDRLVVQTYAVKTRLQEEALNRAASLNNEKIVVMAAGGNIVYKVDFFDNELTRMYGIYILFRHPDKTFDRLLYADSALWNGAGWELGGVTCYSMDGGGNFVVGQPDEAYLSLLTEPPETFRNNTVSVEAVSTSEARAYIEHLEKAGLPSAEAKSEYYKKYAFPFVVFIVVFLAVGLSGKTRKNVLLISLALCITAVVLFYVMQMVTMLMAKFEILPPLFGAWFPVFTFILASIVLLRYART